MYSILPNIFDLWCLPEGRISPSFMIKETHWFLVSEHSHLFSFLYLSNSGSANAQLPGCFRPWRFSLNIGLNMLPFDAFMSCLYSLLGFSTGEFQALQLIVLRRLVPWISYLPPVCWSFFWKSSWTLNSTVTETYTTAFQGLLSPASCNL